MFFFFEEVIYTSTTLTRKCPAQFSKFRSTYATATVFFIYILLIISILPPFVRLFIYLFIRYNHITLPLNLSYDTPSL